MFKPDTNVFLSTLDEVVQERPDYVYANPDERSSSCLYVHPDGPGCMIGTVLHRMGVSLDRLKVFEHKPSAVVMDALGFSQDTSRYGRVLQRFQDDENPWGRCLEKAKDYRPGNSDID